MGRNGLRQKNLRGYEFVNRERERRSVRAKRTSAELFPSRWARGIMTTFTADDCSRWDSNPQPCPCEEPARSVELREHPWGQSVAADWPRFFPFRSRTLTDHAIATPAGAQRRTHVDHGKRWGKRRDVRHEKCGRESDGS